ncbi:Fe-only nitrogenase accessory AnfO family protein [Dethiobacter alkaliphilus]|uniref:Fe-only nitrogenase accessory AnfO family protein n=1 Tax=Dethiobacter alkaliphilus TaxID=427926 RepID=UPI0022273C67|nr:Fe-only nitrogenase accessory AnfO family protein [Dethiobacter alkaliphilus]MCW3490777.1 nitrogenase [Dethiobacter alkaliphilus]
MSKEIAVYCGQDGKTTGMDKPGTLYVFRKHLGEWQVIKSMTVNLNKASGLPELRQKMDKIVEFLGDCKLFLAASVVGIPYFSLEKAGCTIWEFTGHPSRFLDLVLEREEEQAKEKAVTEDVALVPQPMGEGRFSLDLIEIQKNNDGITSKQVLRPFIQKGEFYELRVTCHHVPPWLEAEVELGRLNINVEQTKSAVIAVIIKNTCT